MAYVFLALAIGAEIVATSFLKSSDGYTKFLPTVVSLCMYLVCHLTFSQASTGINLGVAYATWCAVGIIVTALISRFVFGEVISAAGVIGIVFIVIGCVLMNAFG